MGIIVPKLRASAKGQACTFCTPYCNGNPDTVVLCHAPSESKGGGTKSHDFLAAFGCSACHEALDQHTMSNEMELFFWLRGCQRTLTEWVLSGLVVVPVDIETAKRRPKKKARIPSRPLQSRGFPKRVEVWQPLSSGDDHGD